MILMAFAFYPPISSRQLDLDEMINDLIHESMAQSRFVTQDLLDECGLFEFVYKPN